MKGRKNDKKELIVFAIEKKGSGISSVYGKVIPNSSSEELSGFMEATIDKEANIKTDGWVRLQAIKRKI